MTKSIDIYQNACMPHTLEIVLNVNYHPLIASPRNVGPLRDRSGQIVECYNVIQ